MKITKERLSRKRASVNFSTSEALSSIRDTMERLNELWDQISMEESVRCKRVQKFFLYISELLNQVVADEEEMVESIKAGIEESKKQVENLCMELNLPIADKSHLEPGSLALCRALHHDVARLQSLKEDRIQGQKKLVEELAQLAMKTGEEIEDLPNNTVVSDDSVLASLQKRVTYLNEVLTERMQKCKQWQVDMQRWCKQMGNRQLKELGKTFCDLDLDNEELIWDKHFLDEFESAFDEVKIEYNQWVEQVSFDYTEAMIRLEELWDLCHIPDVERNIPRKFDPSIHTVHEIKLVQEKVKTLEKFLNDRMGVYKKLKEWKDLWNAKVEFESNANKKSRYHNRGCELEMALKKQKFIANRLPVLQNELKDEMEKYDATHDTPILLDGLNPCEHVESIMEEYRINKELERKRKKEIGTPTRIVTNMSNMITPQKRGPPSTLTTPCSSAKIAKIQPFAKCDQRVSKMPDTSLAYMRSISASTASLHSVITPVRPSTDGPKTSSPLRPVEKSTTKPEKAFHLPPIYKTPKKQ